MRHRKELRESLTEANGKRTLRRKWWTVSTTLGWVPLAQKFWKVLENLSKSSFSGVVRTEVRGQWVEKGVGVKEDLTMSVQGSFREFQLETDMRSNEFLNLWSNKNKQKQNMKICIGIQQISRTFLYCKTETLYPLNNNSPLSLTPSPRSPPYFLFFYVFDYFRYLI